METMKEGLMRSEGGHTRTLVSNFSDVAGKYVSDQQDKTARHNCTTPECFPYSPDQVLETRVEAQRGTFKEMSHKSKQCAQEQELPDLYKKEASSSGRESDFYDGTEVSCTYERMDADQGKKAIYV